MNKGKLELCYTRLIPTLLNSYVQGQQTHEYVNQIGQFKFQLIHLRNETQVEKSQATLGIKLGISRFQDKHSMPPNKSMLIQKGSISAPYTLPYYI